MAEWILNSVEETCISEINKALEHCIPTLENLYWTSLEERHGEGGSILPCDCAECGSILSEALHYHMVSEPSLRTPQIGQVTGPLHECLSKEGFGDVVPGNVGYSKKGTIVIIFTRNSGWRCVCTVFNITKSRNLKVRNWPHGMEHFMNRGGLSVLIRNDLFWKLLQFVISLKKFIGNALSRKVSKWACFVGIRYLNSHF